jgi:uncharacterized membrane-anchored protein YhcB (DUF1043 family)
MNDVFFGLAALAAGALLGMAAGYWLAQRRARLDAAKAEDVQQRFDDYRRQVTEHFGRTAEHFQAIGEQYRELYEHMASGADTLFDVPVPGAHLEDAARIAVADTVDGEAAPAEPESDAALRAPTDIEWSDVSESEDAEPIDVVAAEGAEVESERPDEPRAGDPQPDDVAAEDAGVRVEADTTASADEAAASADDANDEAPRTYH